MEFVRVAKTGDVAPGEMIPVVAGGAKLLLANIDGVFFAAQRKCPHMGFNLCRGKLEGGSVICALHKARFDLATGAVEDDPHILFITMKTKRGLTTYPVQIDGDAVLIGV